MNVVVYADDFDDDELNPEEEKPFGIPFSSLPVRNAGRERLEAVPESLREEVRRVLMDGAGQRAGKVMPHAEFIERLEAESPAAGGPETQASGPLPWRDGIDAERHARFIERLEAEDAAPRSFGELARQDRPASCHAAPSGRRMPPPDAVLGHVLDGLRQDAEQERTEAPSNGR